MSWGLFYSQHCFRRGECLLVNETWFPPDSTPLLVSLGGSVPQRPPSGKQVKVAAGLAIPGGQPQDGLGGPGCG